MSSSSDDDFDLTNPDTAMLLEKWKKKSLKKKKQNIGKRKQYTRITMKNSIQVSSTMLTESASSSSEPSLSISASPVSATVPSYSVSAITTSAIPVLTPSDVSENVPVSPVSTTDSSHLADEHAISVSSGPAHSMSADFFPSMPYAPSYSVSAITTSAVPAISPSDVSENVSSVSTPVTSASSNSNSDTPSEFSTYEEFIDAFSQHEINTITKYNIRNRSPNFEKDTNINTFLETFATEKDLKSRILWKFQQ